jgi:hypothetical protein
MRMKVVWSLLVSLACVCAASNVLAKTGAVDDGLYTTKDKEYYLSPEQLLFIRPGLEVEVLDVVIPADGQMVVTFSIADPAGLPLDHEGIFTPGRVDMRFTLAYIPAGEEQKVRLAYERTSRNGILEKVCDGTYKYKFDYVMDSDPDTTHSLVLGFYRDLREWGLNRYADNAIEIWVPSGMYAPVPRDIVTGETCNRCHDQLGMHGGRWQSPQACTNCHNPTQNTRFDELIHAVHAGGEAGGHDFSEIHYPAPLSDCQVCHAGGTPTEAFPLVANPSAALICDGAGVGTTVLTWEHTGNVEIKVASEGSEGETLFAMGGGSGSVETGKWVADGTVFTLYDAATSALLATLPVNGTVLGCVGNAPGAPRGEAGAQHTNWLDHPSRVVCGSCHSDIDFENGVGHLAQSNDDRCGNCHRPGIGEEFTRSITGAHAQLYKSPQFPGVNFDFVSVTNSGPGERPVVTFTAQTKNGYLDVNSMNRLRLTITGPNEDFSYYNQEDAVGSSVNVEGNTWTYTFETPLPIDAEGSYSIGVEGRATVDINIGGEVSSERDVLQGVNMAFAVTDAAAVPRRMVVEDEKCEACHVNLALHGGGRTNANYCLTCHMPSLLDIATPAENVSFKWMVHKIHRGAELENGYIVVRSRGTYDFSYVHFPAPLNNCEMCHVNDSQQIPLPAGVLPALTPAQWWTPTAPITAACIACHDSDEAAVHTYTNMSFFGESCATCHGEGKEFSIDKVHAQ